MRKLMQLVPSIKRKKTSLVNFKINFVFSISQYFILIVIVVSTIFMYYYFRIIKSQK